MLMRFSLAVQFLTRLPFCGPKEPTDEDLAGSMAYYPLVGLLLGLILSLEYLLLSWCLPQEPLAVILTLSLILLTGNLHLDGLMDTADGLFSGRDLAGMRPIMKDSRMGAHGVTAGVGALLLRYVLLASLDPSLMLPALLSTPLMGRWVMVYSVARHPYAWADGGLAKVFTEGVGLRELFWASLSAALALLIIWGTMGLGLFALWLLSGAAIAGWLARRFGGVSGDTCGAAGELLEIGVLLSLVAIRRWI
ncbi:MAG: adenosylcobinamide-GDP ribazoletransferase [Firmicutes bacterium]|nr:adenosylcobinamide-GDP ribazoletransferase [Bacillota bacterium]